MSSFPLISIIVPVYNGEKYLHRSIDSLLSQTYSNLEIILVNDGSTDNSPSICDAYASKDSRVKVIHKENGGVSSARNVALDVVCGEYIGFIDADDYADRRMYELLYNNMVKCDADISICGYSQEHSNGEFFPHCSENIYECLDKEEMVTQMLIQKNYTFSLWDKLFSADKVKGIRFDEHITHNEDIIFVYQIMKNCNKAVFSSKPMYYYCNNEQSAARKKFSDKTATMMDAQDIVLADIKENMKQIYDTALTEYIKSTVFCATLAAKGDYKNKSFISRLQSSVRKNLGFYLNSYVARGNKIFALVLCTSYPLFKLLASRV